VQVPHSSVHAVSFDAATGSYGSSISAYSFRLPLTYSATAQGVNVDEQRVSPDLRVRGKTPGDT
jgi:hypothetical protein